MKTFLQFKKDCAKNIIPASRVLHTDNEYAILNDLDMEIRLPKALFKNFEPNKIFDKKITASELPVSLAPGGFKSVVSMRMDLTKKTLDNLKWLKKAICQEQVRYYLTGIFMDMQENRAVATDAHRLHMVDFDKLGLSSFKIEGPNIDSHIIIPEHVITYMLRFIAEYKNKYVHITFIDDLLGQGFSKMSLVFDNGIIIYAKLIDGTFPDYSRLIPKDKNLYKLGNVPEIKQSDVTAAVSMDNCQSSKKVQIMLRHNGLYCFESDWQVINADIHKKKDLELSYNLYYLKEFSKMEMHVVRNDEKNSAAVLRDGNSRYGLLMPMSARNR